MTSDRDDAFCAIIATVDNRMTEERAPRKSHRVTVAITHINSDISRELKVSQI